jgi:16S rRNA (cytosine1402-N4)-methyltransferase
MTEHRPVMVERIAELLVQDPDGIYMDATFGRGGHSRAILSRLSEKGRLIALDRDPEAIAFAQTLNEPRLIIEHTPFSNLSSVLKNLGIAHVHGIVFDLGVSSPQLDNGDRGFSFNKAGPLDMRMDPSRDEPLQKALRRLSEKELADIIFHYGEERYARRIARAIAANRHMDNTLQLADVVAKAIPRWEKGQHPATRTFMALRIFLNRELEEIEKALPAAITALKPGGRLAVLSFHSLEDRIVKRFLKTESRLPQPRLRLLFAYERPTHEEKNLNPRARSAMLRSAEKIEA